MLALILLICTAGLAYGDGGKSKKLKADFGMKCRTGARYLLFRMGCNRIFLLSEKGIDRVGQLILMNKLSVKISFVLVS